MDSASALHLHAFIGEGAHYEGHGLGDVRAVQEYEGTANARTILQVDVNGDGHSDMILQFPHQVIRRQLGMRLRLSPGGGGMPAGRGACKWARCGFRLRAWLGLQSRLS